MRARLQRPFAPLIDCRSWSQNSSRLLPCPCGCSYVFAVALVSISVTCRRKRICGLSASVLLRGSYGATTHLAVGAPGNPRLSIHRILVLQSSPKFSVRKGRFTAQPFSNFQCFGSRPDMFINRFGTRLRWAHTFIFACRVAVRNMIAPHFLGRMVLLSLVFVSSHRP